MLAIALSVGIATATTALQLNGETVVTEPFQYGNDYYTPEEHYCLALNIYQKQIGTFQLILCVLFYPRAFNVNLPLLG